MLETRGLTIRFGGHVAVDAVSCAFTPGTLTAIVGPNGAGKTTYFNLVSGQLPASAGSVHLDGEDITALPAPLRTRRGLGRAFQLTQLFAKLTVLENVRLAVQARRSQGHGIDLWRVWLDRREWIDEAMALLERVQLAPQRDALAAELPHGDQRKLEVAMMIAMKPDIFMFDEPTAGMSAAEAPAILDLIAEIKKDASKTILLVEHKMDVVRKLADRIIVLHNGELVADGKPDKVMAMPIVREICDGLIRAAKLGRTDMFKSIRPLCAACLAFALCAPRISFAETVIEYNEYSASPTIGRGHGRGPTALPPGHRDRSTGPGPVDPAGRPGARGRQVRSHRCSSRRGVEHGLHSGDAEPQRPLRPPRPSPRTRGPPANGRASSSPGRQHPRYRA